MMLFWKIRYLDRTDKEFKERYLRLNTRTLDPTTRAAVELVVESKSYETEREILKYKYLFAEGPLEESGDFDNCERFSGIWISEYFENEIGDEISLDEIAQVSSGDITTRVIPNGAKQCDINLMFATPGPIPLDKVSLTPQEVRLLGYFVRDLRELQDSAFMKDGPGSLKSFGSSTLPPVGSFTLETAVSDEEIRSFVTIFRRLYMTGSQEPASFVKVVPILVKALGDHPYGKWVEERAEEYQRHLDSTPDTRPFVPTGTCTFTTKRLIDVFLYTQYAHQPDAKRQRQFGECLAELNDDHAHLTWMFFTEMWKLGLEIESVGRFISSWFTHYCEHHHVSPDVLNSLRDYHTGIGAAEKEEDRRARLLREKVQQLAADLWDEAGQPAGGPTQFLVVAHDRLSRTMSS